MVAWRPVWWACDGSQHRPSGKLVPGPIHTTTIGRHFVHSAYGEKSTSFRRVYCVRTQDWIHRGRTVPSFRHHVPLWYCRTTSTLVLHPEYRQLNTDCSSRSCPRDLDAHWAQTREGNSWAQPQVLQLACPAKRPPLPFPSHPATVNVTSDLWGILNAAKKTRRSNSEQCLTKQNSRGHRDNTLGLSQHQGVLILMSHFSLHY